MRGKPSWQLTVHLFDLAEYFLVGNKMTGDVFEALFEPIEIGCRYAEIQGDIVHIKTVNALGHAARPKHVLAVGLAKQNDLFCLMLHSVHFIRQSKKGMY